MDSFLTVADLLTRAEFIIGIVLGAAPAAYFYSVGKPRSSGWALGVAATSLAGLLILEGLLDGLLVGVSLLAAAGLLLGSQHSRGAWQLPTKIAGLGTLVIGAVVVTTIGGLDVSIVVRLLAPVAVVAIGLAVWRWRFSTHAPMLGPLFAFTAFGIWVTVPDTEHARMLLGAAVPLAFSTTKPGGKRLTSLTGALAMVSVVTWVILVGGSAREASIIGAWGAFGMIFILPALGDWTERLPPALVAGTHIVFVIVSTRVIGLWELPVPAVAALAGLTLLTGVVLLLVSGREPVVKDLDSPSADA